MTKQLRAFTILETLLSIMLISIIVSLSYLMLNLFNKQMILLEKENTAILEYNLFNNTIKCDINATNSYIIENETLILKQYNGLITTYRFNKENILRQKKKSIDTFNILTTDFKYVDIKNSIGRKRMMLTLEVLNDKIVSYYLLNKSIAETINKTYFDED